jgi:membrane-bound lytic murein transglycosylase A
VLIAAWAMAVTGGAEAAADARLRMVDFAAIPGWTEDDQNAALGAFLRSCAAPSPKVRPAEILCEAADRLGPGASATAARAFFERHFVPHEVDLAPPARSLFTGYFEPELGAAREPGAGFEVPLLAPPEGLTTLGADDRGDLDRRLSHALRVEGRLAALPTRAEIEAGALSPTPRIIAWLDPIDAFFLHVQGSGRLDFGDGTSQRVTYAGKNGHPYTSVGRLLVEGGEMARDEVSMDTIRAWMAADTERARALMHRNESYIFFREAPDAPGLGPIGHQEVALTAGRSLAVDLSRHAPGTPIWLDTRVPDAGGRPPVPFRRLMVAQDTGSAIVGAARGDIFFGSGAAAGHIAGRMQAEGRMVVLLPRETAP